MTVGLAPGPDGWFLDPTGAAVHPGEATAVIADVHLGYEWSRGAGGDCVPSHSLAETIAKLDRLLSRVPVPPRRLIVAGDLVESRVPCPRTNQDVHALRGWLEARGVTPVFLKGNHDPPGRGWPSLVEVAGWTIAHGDRPIVAPRTITGHDHPAHRADGLVAPCFLVGPSTIVLPAYSANAAGVSLLTLGLERHPEASRLRCLAEADGHILDFGPILPLLDALRNPGAPGRKPAASSRQDRVIRGGGAP